MQQLGGRALLNRVMKLREMHSEILGLSNEGLSGSCGAAAAAAGANTGGERLCIWCQRGRMCMHASRIVMQLTRTTDSETKVIPYIT